MSTKPTLQLRDLLTDPATGRLSHTRLWSNLGCLVATVLFAKIGWTGELSPEVWAIFLVGVCGSAAVSKLTALKYRANASVGAGAQGYPDAYPYPAPGAGRQDCP